MEGSGTMVLVAVLALVPASVATARDALVLDGSASVQRRDASGLTEAAARLLLLGTEPQRDLAIYDGLGNLAYLSSERADDLEMAAASDAVERLLAGSTSSSLLQAVQGVAAAEGHAVAGAGPGPTVYLVGDGVPSLPFAAWERDFGVRPELMQQDPAAWLRATQTAFDERLAPALASLLQPGGATTPARRICWISPRGSRPGPRVTDVILDGGGLVLAGGGMADLQQLLAELMRHRGDSGHGRSWILPFGDDERSFRVPPGAVRLEILFCKPGLRLEALTVTGPRGAKSLPGLGQVVGKHVLDDPAPGTWRLEAAGEGLALVGLDVDLALAPREPFDGPGRTGQIRTGTVQLVDGHGALVDPDAFDEVTVTRALGDAQPVTLERRDQHWLVPMQLPDRPGELPVTVTARLRQGQWEDSLELVTRVPVLELTLVHDMPHEPVLAGTGSVEVQVLANGSPWARAGTSVSLIGFSEVLQLQQDGDRWKGQYRADAGYTDWELRASFDSGGARMSAHAVGTLVAGALDLELGGDLVSGSFTGRLEARSSFPIELPLEVSWVGTSGRLAGRRLGTLSIVVPPAEAGDIVRTWPIEIAPPAEVGRHPGRLVVRALGPTALSEESIPVTFEVQGWWSRNGGRALASAGALVLALLLAVAVLRSRPYLQGELTVHDAQGRQLQGPLALSSFQRSLGRRRVTVGGAPEDDCALPADAGLEPCHVTLRGRRGDLGIVWTEIENTGSRAIEVAGTVLRPRERCVLGHEDEIRVGRTRLRHEQPLVVDMVALGSGGRRDPGASGTGG